MPKQTLKLLNTHLKRGVTPPTHDSYPVYIPADKLALLEKNYHAKRVAKLFCNA
jgi:hypothetical protein